MKPRIEPATAERTRRAEPRPAGRARRLMLCGLAVVLVPGCASAGPEAAERIPTPEQRIGVGYGTQTRQDVTGSVSSLEEQDFDDVRATRVEELLEGRVAGLQVTRLPNGALSVRIRGSRSFLGSNEPLYVVDGVPLFGGLTGINPHDIARIEVLKDAGATAIYGSRGANGVVLITTKRAR